MAAKKRKAAKKAVKKKKAPRSAARQAERRKGPVHTLRLESAFPGYTVNDLQRSLHFYRDVLGFHVSDKWEQNGVLTGVELKAGTTALYIMQDDFKKGRDRIKGLGVRIYTKTTQDIDALAAGIKSRGGALDHEPETQSWGSRDFGITDPDGYKLSISQDV